MSSSIPLLRDNKSWLRKDGELYLAVKVVDQEVNRLDRVRFFHLFHILLLSLLFGPLKIALKHILN